MLVYLMLDLRQNHISVDSFLLKNNLISHSIHVEFDFSLLFQDKLLAFH
jgi:hypothetical protein